MIDRPCFTIFIFYSSSSDPLGYLSLLFIHTLPLPEGWASFLLYINAWWSRGFAYSGPRPTLTFKLTLFSLKLCESQVSIPGLCLLKFSELDHPLPSNQKPISFFPQPWQLLQSHDHSIPEELQDLTIILFRLLSLWQFFPSPQPFCTARSSQTLKPL